MTNARPGDDLGEAGRGPEAPDTEEISFTYQKIELEPSPSDAAFQKVQPGDDSPPPDDDLEAAEKGSQEEYLKIEFEDVLVSSYHVGGSEDGTGPVHESIEFNYGKVADEGAQAPGPPDSEGGSVNPGDMSPFAFNPQPEPPGPDVSSIAPDEGAEADQSEVYLKVTLENVQVSSINPSTSGDSVPGAQPGDEGLMMKESGEQPGAPGEEEGIIIINSSPEPAAAEGHEGWIDVLSFPHAANAGDEEEEISTLAAFDTSGEMSKLGSGPILGAEELGDLDDDLEAPEL